MNPAKRLRLTSRQARVLEVAFIVQDPCGECACELAREVIGLIEDRDDCDAKALASELRALRLKYPIHVTEGGSHD